MNETLSPRILTTLKKIDPSVFWERFPIQETSSAPYGVVMLAGHPVIRFPKNIVDMDDFLIAWAGSSYLLDLPCDDELDSIIEKAMNEPMSFDIETTSLSPYRPGVRVISFSISFKDASYSVPIAEPFVDADTAKKYEEFMLTLVTKAKYLVAFNGKFDFTYLAQRYPDRVKYEEIQFKFDPMIAAHVLSGAGLQEYNLGFLTRHYLPETRADWKGGPAAYLAENYSRTSDRTFDKVPIHILLPYGRRDAYYTFLLFENLLPKLESENLTEIYHTVHHRINYLCHRMNYDGLWLNRFFIDYLDQLYLNSLDSMSKKTEEQFRSIMKSRVNILTQQEKQLTEKDCEALQSFADNLNINSSQQMAEALYTVLGLPVLERTAETNMPKTNASFLLKLAAFDPPLFSSFITYKKWTKYHGYLKNYLKLACQEGGQPDSQRRLVCHSEFNPTGTRTGRMASQNPNAQNISVGSGLKGCFTTPDLALLTDELYRELQDAGMLTHIASYDEVTIRKLDEEEYVEELDELEGGVEDV
jgi:DNA polymerase-1